MSRKKPSLRLKSVSITKFRNHQNLPISSMPDKITSELYDLVDANGEFTITYLSGWDMIAQGMNLAQIKVYAHVVSEGKFGLFKMSKKERIEAGKLIGLTERTIADTMDQLVALDMFYGRNGMYAINPEYVFRGNTNSRNIDMKKLLLERLNDSKKDNDSAPSSSCRK